MISPGGHGTTLFRRDRWRHQRALPRDLLGSGHDFRRVPGAPRLLHHLALHQGKLDAFYNWKPVFWDKLLEIRGRHVFPYRAVVKGLGLYNWEPVFLGTN